MNTPNKVIRVATFNVSMEALNYRTASQIKDKTPVKSDALLQALLSQHQQIKNIAEIIQKTNPDIILLNEFDRTDNGKQALKTFQRQYLEKSQNGNDAIHFPYFYQGPVNTGVIAAFDLNNDGQKSKAPADTYGFGYFPGHFAMVLLSKYPIDVQNIRTFQLFKWQDMPNALKPILPQTNKPWYSEQAWQNMRLSSKSHWDIPITINQQSVHILASHPTPPVFDGPENRNGKRNHDEIRFWADYIEPTKSAYIYDDNGNKGGLVPQQTFIILGDQNASVHDGDAVKSGINMLLDNKKVQDAKPESIGGKNHNKENIQAINHTAFWGMRADYVLPSTLGFHIKASGIFWPLESDNDYRLIKDRQASSDHRLVWLDLEIVPVNKTDKH